MYVHSMVARQFEHSTCVSVRSAGLLARLTAVNASPQTQPESSPMMLSRMIRPSAAQWPNTTVTSAVPRDGTSNH
ncbi:MAG: hypothetical protein QOD67_5152, partial [Caballeronia sp.]|nr:hypothetical protein [Caballeronia sp.]